MDNPFTASAEKGKRIIHKKAEIMAEFINEVKEIKVEVRNRDYADRTFRPMSAPCAMDHGASRR